MTSYIDHWKLIVMSFILSMTAMFQFAYNLTDVNCAENAFVLYVNNSHYESSGVYLNEQSFAWIWSIIVNCFLIGFLVGTVATPFLTEKFGRKWSLIFSSVFDVIGAMVQVLSICYKMPDLLAVGRWIVGIGSGISSGAITLYLQEISPTHVRGLVSSFQELSISVISLFGLVLGLPSLLGSSDYLLYLVGVCIAPALPKFILLWCPDTPKFLYLQKRNAALAVNAIRFYHGTKVNVDNVVEEIRKEGEIEVSPAANEIHHNRRRNSLQLVVYEPYLRKALVLGIVCFVAQETTGIVPLVEFSTKLLNYLAVDESVSSLAAILIGIFNVITTTLALFLVERYGRKKLLLSGFTGILGFQIILMTAYIAASYVTSAWPGYLAAVCIVGITTAFGLGPGNIPWFITSELVPQTVRSSAATLTQVCNILVMFAVNFTFLPLFYSVTAYSFLILFIVPTAVCVIYLYFALPETKNKEIVDIVRDLQNPQKICVAVTDV